MPVVGGTGNEVLLKLLVVSQPWKRFRAGADKIATGALLLTLQGHELATAVVNHGDGWVCKPSSATRRAITTASSGVWIDAPITELMLTLNSAYWASHYSFLSSTFRLFQTSSGRTLSNRQIGLLLNLIEWCVGNSVTGKPLVTFTPWTALWGGGEK